MAKKKTHQQLLADVVKKLGSQRAVSEQLDCSQQSVNAWIKCEWLPRRELQLKMKELYRIPVPWVMTVRTKTKNVKAGAV